MPIWLRRFTFNKLKEWYEKQNAKNDNRKDLRTTQPGIDSTYNIKAPRK